MVRRAAWRALPYDPKGSVGWTLRTLGSPEFRRSLAWFCLTLGASALLMIVGTDLPTIVFVATAFVRSHGGLVAFVLAAMTAGGLALLRARDLVLCTLEEQLILPLPPDTIRVRATFRFGGATMGYDAGIVSFVDGWLHFEGARTSFSVAAGDVLVGTDPGWWRVRLTFSSEQSVWLVPVLSADGRALATATERWAYDRQYVPGEATLPPLAVLPLARAQAQLSVGLSSIGFFVVAFMAMPGQPGERRSQWGSSRSDSRWFGLA